MEDDDRFSIEDCREWALQIIATKEIDWTSDEFAAYLFGIMQPRVRRKLSGLMEDRVPESDAEAISRVLDRADYIEPIDGKTLKDARP